MITDNLVKELETLLKIELDSTLFPYQKGKSVRIGHIVIRESNQGYKIFDTNTNRMVCDTFSKTSAVAIARNLAKGKSDIKEILFIDKTIKKNYIDCIFYRHNMLSTNDYSKKAVLETRYEDAKSRTEYARHVLDKYIFD